MISPVRLSISTLLAATFLSGIVEPALAQQFYNPWRYHQTRQAITNRAITKRLGRRTKVKTVKRSPRRNARTATKTAPRKPSR